MEYNSLLPKEPLKRANIRFAIEYYASNISPNIYSYARNKEANAEETFRENVNKAFKRVSIYI
jgi:glutathione S-transferase